MRIALAQINPLVGDLKGNSEAIISACKKAVSENADIVVTPELSLWGYPPRDLLLNQFLIKKQNELIENICKTIRRRPAMISNSSRIGASGAIRCFSLISNLW